MQRSVISHKILDVVQASGADITVKNRYLYIKGNMIGKFDDMEKDGVQQIVAVSSVTQAVLTFSVPAVPLNSSATVPQIYSIQVTVDNPGATGVQNNPLVFNFSVTTPVTGTLANTDLVTLFKTLINSTSQSYSTYFVATGTTTLILTATTAYPVMIGTPTAPITVAQTTQGVQLAGQVANMKALGVVTASTPTRLNKGQPTNTYWITGTSGTLSNAATTGYTAFTFFSALDVGESNTARVNQKGVQYLWVNNADANAAAFCSILNAVLGGYQRNGTTVNFKELEVKDIYPSIQ